MIIPSDKTPRAVRFSKFISQSPLACLGSRVQGSRAFSPVENSFQNLLDEVFCDLVCTAHLQYILNFDLLRAPIHKKKNVMKNVIKIVMEIVIQNVMSIVRKGGHF